MNADRTQLRSIKTSDLVIDGVGIFSVASFTIQEGINRPPTVTVTCFPKADSELIPVMIEAEKSLNLFHARAANVIYNRPYAINCRFTITQTAEGKDQTFEIKGVLGSSSPQVTKEGGAGLQITIAHPVHLLATADTSIYASRADPGSSISTNPVIENVVKTTDNLADLVFAVLKAWESDFEQRTLSVEPPPVREMLMATHNSGQTGRDYLRKILSDSKPSLVFPALRFVSESNRVKLVSNIHTALVSSNNLMSGMFGTGGFGYLFGLLWRIPANASWNVVARSMDTVGDAASRTLKTSYVNYNPSVGSPDGIPVRGVKINVTNMPIATGNIPVIGGNISIGTAYIGYPEAAVKAGRPRIVEIGFPEWASIAALSSGGLPGTDYEVNSTTGRPQKPIAIKRVFGQHVKASAKESDKISDLMKEWARMHYVYTALDTSTDTLNVPLNLTGATPGEVLTVASSSGVPLYDGFVAGVTHAVNLPSNQATTTIQFSHVRPNGFVLPET